MMKRNDVSIEVFGLQARNLKVWCSEARITEIIAEIKGKQQCFSIIYSFKKNTMEPKKSVTHLLQGVEMVLSKYRASLAVEEVEHLENAIAFLRAIEDSGDQKGKQLLVLKVIYHLSKFLAHPEIMHKISDAFHQIAHLL